MNGPSQQHEEEATRILREYERRERELPSNYYSVFRPSILFAKQQRVRTVIKALSREGMDPLSGRKVLEVGCGKGNWLADMEDWGAKRENLSGIELDLQRKAQAAARFAAHQDETGRVLAPGADIRIGNATTLPWADESFDIVIQSTVFSSILDHDMKHRVAEEMARVLMPLGIIIWYDFSYNNPRNPNVRGIGHREIRSLFPGFSTGFHRITLAPPLASWVVPKTWLGALFLEKVGLFNTHILGILRREKSS